MASKSNDSPKTSSASDKGTSKKKVSSSSGTSRSGKNDKRNVKRPRTNDKSPAKEKRDSFAKMKQEQKQNRREFLGVIFFIMAFIFMLCWFNTDTMLLSPLSKIVSGLFGGMGKILLPFLLVYNGIILFINRGYPVRMRTWCGFFAMIFLCGVIHSIADFFGNIGNSLSAVTLWKNGLVWRSGGLIPGFIAELLRLFITRFGAIVFMLVAMLLCLLGTRNITLPGIINAVKKRTPAPAPEDREDASERFVERIVQVHQEKQVRRKSPSDYDVDVDDPPLLKNKPGGKKENRTSDSRELSPSEMMAQRSRHGDRFIKDIDMEKRQMTMDEVEVHEPREPASMRNRVDRVVIMPTDTVVMPAEHETVKEEKPHKEEPAPVKEKEIPFEELPVEEAPVAEKAPHVIPQPVKKVTAEEAQLNAALISAEIAEQTTPEVEYVFPTIDLLNRGSGGTVDATAEMRGNSKRLADALQSFGVTPHIVDVIRGPSVTRYELELDPGVKLSKITNLSEDIALALGAQGVRISAIPDKISVVGIEVPNKMVNTVYAREVIGSPLFTEKKSKVSFAVGKDISGTCIIGDIGKMPHMLIAGTTGSGKSVCMNTLIISLLYKAKPDEVKMIMVDPKMVELGVYNGIPHLLIPVVTDPKKAAGALQWTVTEMLRRYGLMRDEGVRDLESYNKAVANDPDREKLPQVVVVIDELADLMLVAAKEVEESICRIAQMGRASGIHLVIATQRPSADVITGTMKANIPSRIAFSVSSAMESRIILDMQGAEKLVGKGDMLFAPHGQGKPQRVQGCFITDDEVSRVVEAIKANTGSDYSHEVMEQIEKRAEQQGNKNAPAETAPPPESNSDEMLPAAVEVILETGQASVSMLQRRLKLGYARAARIVDEMEEKGIVGPFEGAKPRQLLITREQWEQMKNGAPEPVPDEIP